ncbi:MAG: hypothetical protein LBJ95_02105 [Oscillospiraceae bacterium]|nr:hypothetical protein [Oscillospiraceae bacterium]
MPGLELSFVRREFDCINGKVMLIEEFRTPWSAQNAVFMQKSTLQRRPSSRTKTQISVEVRIPNSHAPITTYIIR